MLVLSRRPGETIQIPLINTSVQVVEISPRAVRLGIDAPSEVQIFPGETLAGVGPIQPVSEPAAARIRELNHVIRNRLNAATLGLALLRRQLRAGMTVDSESTLDRIATEFQTLQQQVEQTTRALAQASRPARVRKALLVEDDHNERELLAGFLRMAGLDVATAGDGTDALDYLRNRGRPDVVLLDMVLPGCDGPATVRAIRRDPDLRGVKIFGVTGHDPGRFGLEDGHAGVDGWFQKPLNPEKLLRDLHREFGECAQAEPTGKPSC